MSTAKLDQTVKALILILDKEKEALLGGNYVHLDPIRAQKEKVTNELTAGLGQISDKSVLESYGAAIEQIRVRAIENEKLLATAKSGVASARARLQAVLNRENTVGTYTAGGYKLPTHSAGVSRNTVA